jgi:hypothetical protein
MKKIIKLTEDDLARIVNQVIKESDTSSSEGFGLLNSKQGEMSEQDNTSLMSKGQYKDFILFLKQQGFRDFSEGNRNYGLRFHYISRKPGTPANLTCVVSQSNSMSMGKVSIQIVFDRIVESANRYPSAQEYMSKSPIVKIEKLAGKDFDIGTNNNFTLDIKEIDLQKAKQIIGLYNQIKLTGPYSEKYGKKASSR